MLTKLLFFVILKEQEHYYKGGQTNEQYINHLIFKADSLLTSLDITGTVISAPTNIAGAELLNQEYIMLYMIDAGDGQSGSPIYYQSSDGSWISIGIHTADYTYADGTGQLNQGNRFTSQLFSFVLAYTSSH